MKKRVLPFIIILLILLVSVAGCGKAPVKNESDIMSDLIESKYYMEIVQDSSIKELEIIKRQTDVENKTDKVYVTLSATNSDGSIEGYLDLLVLYGLYEDGWVLDSCEIDYEGEHNGVYFFPTKGQDLSVEDISADLAAVTGEAYTDVTIYDTGFDPENGVEFYSVTGTANHTYMTGTIDATLTYYFSSSIGGWDTPTLDTNSYDENWNLSGEYQITRNGKYITYNEGPDCLKILDGNRIDDITVLHVFGKYEKELENGAMYSTKSTTQSVILENALEVWNHTYQIQTKGYSTTVAGDYSSINGFEYVIYWKNGYLLCIGKESLALCSKFSSTTDIDDRNGRMIVRIWNLVPVDQT